MIYDKNDADFEDKVKQVNVLASPVLERELDFIVRVGENYRTKQNEVSPFSWNHFQACSLAKTWILKHLKTSL